jgi:hypothetical protein
MGRAIPVSDQRSARENAETRLLQALQERGARDPRGFYRERLRALRDADPPAYQRAVEHFETRLVPAVGSGDTDPLGEWLEYGRFLAELTAPGRTVQIDPSGEARDYAPPVPDDHLVLHLPDSTRAPALVVGLPPELSPPQRAAYELLVSA